jgi:UDP-2-acetamido-2,6-beta-L-arabino-hexul-4-ose reductase
MRRVVVTGARGFIGRNLTTALRRRDDVEVVGFDVGDPVERLAGELAGAEVVFHLAGVNRPKDPQEFETGNAGFTRELCDLMTAAGARPVVAFASSTQAELDNPYGASKLAAEAALEDWSRSGGGAVAIFRLANVFGKWGRPDYNSVTATFCYNTAHGLPLRVDDPSSPLRLVYVTDVVEAFVGLLDDTVTGVERRSVGPTIDTTVGELAERVGALHALQHTADVPDLSSHFDRALHSTYLSYLEPEDLSFPFVLRSDERGALAELVRKPGAGQIFFSRTHPGVTRGNHYHETKVERFIVLAGEGLVRLRRVDSDEVEEYAVSGAAPEAVIIPPGTTHSIENTGAGEMLTLFWADEVFDPDRPDTYYEPVLREGGNG